MRHQKEKGLLNCLGACWEPWGSGQAGLALLRGAQRPALPPTPSFTSPHSGGGVGPKPFQVKLTKGYYQLDAGKMRFSGWERHLQGHTDPTCELCSPVPSQDPS